VSITLLDAAGIQPYRVEYEAALKTKAPEPPAQMMPGALSAASAVDIVAGLAIDYVSA